MKRFSKYMVIGFTGGSVYYSFEILFRGYSHWTMFVLGGICLIFIYIQGSIAKWKDPLLLQILRCTLFVTSMEFITGIIVNKWFDLNVWNYERMPFHLFGQICLPFTVIFSGLCVLGIFLSSYIGYRVYGEEKPHYRIL